MELSEMIALISSVLEMEEQGDRSVALDQIREGVNSLYTTSEEQKTRIADLEGQKDRLIERNNQLFHQVESTKQPSETQQDNTPKALNDVIGDLFK